MNKLLKEIEDAKIITILRGFSLEETLKTAHALYEGGIRFIEITFNQTTPNSCTGDAISLLRKELPSIHIGAGTVITQEQLSVAHAAGAEFILSPDANPEIIKKTKDYGLLSIPGAMTPNEIIMAYNAGADIVKIFPLGALGLPYLKAILAPINHIPLAAVGGVSLDNIQEFLYTGAFCVGIGSNIADTNAIKTGQYHIVKNLAQAYVNKVYALSGE